MSEDSKAAFIERYEEAMRNLKTAEEARDLNAMAYYNGELGGMQSAAACMGLMLKVGATGHVTDLVEPGC